MGVILTGYAELLFDSWVNTSSPDTKTEDADSEDTRTAPPEAMFSGMLFEPQSYIYSRRIVVSSTASSEDSAREASCIFYAKTDCTICLLYVRSFFYDIDVGSLTKYLPSPIILGEHVYGRVVPLHPLYVYVRYYCGLCVASVY